MEKSFPDYGEDYEYNTRTGTGAGTHAGASCHFGLGFHAGVMHELIQSDLVESLKMMFPLAPEEFLQNEVSVFFRDGYYFDENGNSVTESEMLARLMGRLLKRGISETTDGRSDGAALNAAESPAPTTSFGFGTQFKANFDCGCCFESSPASVKVSCEQGHAFCQSCVKRYVDFIVSGEGSSSFVCMSDGCSAAFSTSSLHFVEPRRLKQLEDRQQSEDVAKALAFSSTDEQLHQCPFCDFKCVIPNGNKVFKCHNPSCHKESCKLCKKIWEGHFGLPCDEVEAKDESDLRTRTEEAMTKAVVRRCLKCNTPFIKDEGCNKMTCRCGFMQCYLCHQSLRNDFKGQYKEHYCQHVTENGACNQCGKCKLHEDAEVKDRAMVEKERQNGKQQLIQQGLSVKRKTVFAEDDVKNLPSATTSQQQIQQGYGGNQYNWQPPAPVCYNCGETGHVARNCYDEDDEDEDEEYYEDEDEDDYEDEDDDDGGDDGYSCGCNNNGYSCGYNNNNDNSCGYNNNIGYYPSPLWCYNCGNPGYKRTNCPRCNGAKRPRYETRSCYSCGSMDHFVRDCPNSDHCY